MKTLQVNTSDINGGAARAAYRLHKALEAEGARSAMLVRVKESEDPSVVKAVTKTKRDQLAEEFNLSSAVQERYVKAHRTGLSNTVFSLHCPGYDISGTAAVREADVVNLHWINYFLSLVSIRKLSELKKKLVWTLHDQWPYTGGCHYAAGCDGYRVSCAPCPQLKDPYNVPGAVFGDKAAVLTQAGIIFVCPSRWMARCAENSALFKGSRIEVIPNSVELDSFAPMPREEARKRLGIALHAGVILFGAELGHEKRKGFSRLLEALGACKGFPEFRQRASGGRLVLLVFGSPDERVESLGIPIKSLGYVKSDQVMRDLYCAADVYVLPSLEDNLPNTMLEAMACGTPVTAFSTGGMPDAVRHGETGFLAPPGDPGELARHMARLLLDPALSLRMGEECRRMVEREYAPSLQAGRYMALYSELLKEKKPGGGKFPPLKNESVPFLAETGPEFARIYKDVLGAALAGARDAVPPEGTMRTDLLPVRLRLAGAQVKFRVKNLLRPAWHLLKRLRKRL